MPTLTSLKISAEGIYLSESSVPSLMIPPPSQGEEGQKLLELLTRIVSRWRERPPQGLGPELKLYSETESPQLQENQVALDLLRSWREDDEDEQRETWEYLKRALDADRLSDRPFFP